MYTFFHITALDTEELREGDLDRSKLRKLDPEAVAGGQLFQGPKVKESISEQRKQVCFQQAHNQGLCQLFSTVSLDLGTLLCTPLAVSVYLCSWKATHKASQGSLKGVM